MKKGGGLGKYGTAAGPASYTGRNLTIAVLNGTIPMSQVDCMIIKTMALYFYLRYDSNYCSVYSSTPYFNINTLKSTWIREFVINGTGNRDFPKGHSNLIRKIGIASTVLLNKLNSNLPLWAPSTIAVFENNATESMSGYESENFIDFEYGTLAAREISGTGRFNYPVTPLEAIKSRSLEDGTFVQKLLSNTMVANIALWPLLIKTPPELYILFLKTLDSEGTDRNSFSFDWKGDKVVENVASFCNNKIVVTHLPGTNMMP